MALLFAEGFDGWNGGSDLANATRSINAGPHSDPGTRSATGETDALLGP